jgi:RNA polymerase sigma-70 factor (ECF subfamily)
MKSAILDSFESPPNGSAADDALAGVWMREIANGDRASFHRLYNRFEGLIFTTVQRVLNDRQDTEDVVQEVFSQVWLKASLFQPDKGKPATWLASMARHRAIDRLRLKQRRARLRDEMEGDLLARRSDRLVPCGSELTMRRENCHRVRQAVTKLAPDQQEAISLAYFDGMTQRAIAERLGAPLGTVKARIRRGMGKLRDQF